MSPVTTTPSPLPLHDKAREWIGTTFHHQGRVKKNHRNKGAVDCIGLIVGVLDEMNYRDASGKKISSYDTADYSSVGDSHRLTDALSAHFEEVDTLAAGHIALVKTQELAFHVGILSQDMHGYTLIHASIFCGGVVEETLTKAYKRTIFKIFKV